MSPKLKPLILPQLVEERRRLEVQRPSTEDEPTYIFYTHNSSSSDIASPSPATPTFSRGHSRYSGSTSSLELMPPSCAESPVSPTTQLPHQTKNSKSQLPDVQEDPLEREDEDTTILAAHPDFDECFCENGACARDDAHLAESTFHPLFISDVDYDLGFLSDSDFAGSPRYKKRRNGSESSFGGWSTRLGARFPSIPRWRSTLKRSNLTFSPASEPSFDRHPSLSHAASSRSSSVSALSRRVPDRTGEPPVPSTPALSLYGSAESIALPAPLDIDKANVRESLERDRSLATTPLLPPLLTEKPPLHPIQVPSLQPSPLQSPSVAPSPIPDALASCYPTPPLSTKASVSSFRRKGSLSCATGEMPSSIPDLLEQHDAWSDRLGHANFTIIPRPYLPEMADMETLVTFRGDWDLARVNYTKHLVRTGEHYGTTSKTYALTQAKWAEIEREWHTAEDRLIDRLATEQSKDALALVALRRAPEDTAPATVPRMLSAEGKFPERGDVDIVGPMTRDAVMVRDGPEEKRNGAALWLKNFAGKVGFRR
ncbi:hypothetical protein GQ53DRAFT_349294 [Thozetella sp. PMI_491]|nr:hypothetical protein GQ53DRAFT_349294 [Thozetella sp. PMI_491]